MVGAIPGIRGRLVSSSFVHDLLPSLDGYEDIPAVPARAIEKIATRSIATLGPASGVRTVADAVVVPLLRALGFATSRRLDDPARCVLELSPAASSSIGREARTAALIAGFGEPLAGTWREAVRAGVASDAHWSLCSNGIALRIIDARRTWSREYLEFDLTVLSDSHAAQCALWSLVRAEALCQDAPLLDRAVSLSASHGVEVCRALGTGVLEALQSIMTSMAPDAGRRHAPAVLFEQSLTVLYRVLFLLFAEARRLVPVWHPIYRDRYSLDVIVSSLIEERRPRGLWKALQAIAHLAHAGCAAGELSVTAFNGRLFAPAQTAAFDRRRVDDSVIANALVSVATTSIGKRRQRIAYRDLDVEQLGAVYERVLDYQPAPAGRTVALVRSGDARKATGTFYTPRSVTGFLVRHTLDPLVEGRSAESILNLRVLDPAMGSGAFLVAACRHLAAAAERALIAEGRWHPHDVSAADRVLLRRQIASRCLFGVDMNPTAVHLARLSLWLAALSTDKPLSFLDHHLVAGNSLVGATPDDVRRQPSGGHGRRADALPLFDDQSLTSTLAEGAAARMTLTMEADDSAAVVRGKERRLSDLTSRTAPLGRWARALDLWCAGWFWDRTPALDARLAGELLSHVLSGPRHLGDRFTTPLLAHAEEVARQQHFLHWPLAFPEVFYGSDGRRLPDAGFDAVVGNPPWDMVRGDGGPADVRGRRRLDARHLSDFVRESGVYKVAPRAHPNRYQLFVERALQLVRPGGRVGLVLPSGITNDAGSAPIRRFLFDRAEVDQITGLDNRDGIFPIHRGMRFVLMTCTAGRSTSAIRCRFGVSRVDELERPESEDQTVSLTRALVTRLSGSDALGVPELRSEQDLRLVERISAALPQLAAPDGWNVQFGRELNASDDRADFEPLVTASRARPVVEGKQIEPFRVFLDRSHQQLKPGVRDRVPRRARLAYRDVASATNRVTLIAAIIPARAVTTHTLFCLKTALPADSQLVLCGLLNSYVANYLIRLRVNTHVTASLMSRLPVPRVGPEHRSFGRLVSLIRGLVDAEGPAEETDAYAELQAIAAKLYGLSGADLEHVLSTFPLVGDATKARVRTAFADGRH